MYTTLRSRPCSRPFSHHTTPNSPLYSTLYSILLSLPHPGNVVDPIRGWSRLIRFFMPKSVIPSSPNPSSRCDVDFIVARRNRFIQKFARTPSAVTLFYSPLFSGSATALRRLTNKCITHPIRQMLFFSLLLFQHPSSLSFSLLPSLNTLSMYVVYLVFASISYSA